MKNFVQPASKIINEVLSGTLFYVTGSRATCGQKCAFYCCFYLGLSVNQFNGCFITRPVKILDTVVTQPHRYTNC